MLGPYEDNIIDADGLPITIRGFRNDYISRVIRRGGFYEVEMLDFIRRRYGSGGLYVDFGAFIGNHTLYFAKVCRADLVIAVEPSPETFRLLTYNIEVNGALNVTPFNVAVGSATGRCDIRVQNPWNMGANVVISSPSASIPMVKGDDLISARPKVIKVDTEGWAIPVLKGCERLLSEFHPVLAIEAFPEPVEAITEYLSGMGYSLKGTYNFTETYIYE